MNEQEYKTLRNKIDKYDAEARAKYGQKNGWVVIPGDATDLPEKPSNEERSSVEVFEFMRDKPERYFAYVKRLGINDNRCIVTTWTGDMLGVATLGREYSSYGFGTGSVRRSITMEAINGLRYFGTYYVSAGDYCRLKRAKSA